MLADPGSGDPIEKNKYMSEEKRTVWRFKIWAVKDAQGDKIVDESKAPVKL
jgi:hypothetical protein